MIRSLKLECISRWVLPLIMLLTLIALPAVASPLNQIRSEQGTWSEWHYVGHSGGAWCDSSWHRFKGGWRDDRSTEGLCRSDPYPEERLDPLTSNWAAPQLSDKDDDDDDDDEEPSRIFKRKAHTAYSVGFSILSAHDLFVTTDRDTYYGYLSWAGPTFGLCGWLPLVSLSSTLTLALDGTAKVGYGAPTGNTDELLNLYFAQIPAHAVIQWGGLRRRTYAWGAGLGIGATAMFVMNDAVGGSFVAPSMYAEIIYARKWHFALRFQLNLSNPEYNVGRNLQAMNVSLNFGP
jgi:hypothetical protein